MKSMPHLLAFMGMVAALPASAHDCHRGVTLKEMQTSNHVYRKDPPAPHTLGGPFELMDHTGRTVTNTPYPGKRLLINFGFTGCREACPTGLVNMAAALARPGADADRIRSLFIDFSMEESDLTGLAQFVENFPPRLIGLTGSPEQISSVASAFGAPVAKSELSGSNYSMSHSSRAFFMDRYGMLARPVSYSDSDAISALSRRLLAQ